VLIRTSKIKKAVAAVICAAVAALSVIGTPALADDPPDPASEQYRPFIQYSPTKNWMNDPNGLVFYQGSITCIISTTPRETRGAT
jgi:levanase